MLSISMGELLSLRGVRLHFWRGERHVVRVLERVSLGVWAGEVVGVLAQRGQGKTTLLRVAAGMVRPGGGRVFFDGLDVWGMTDERRAELLAGEIGWVGGEAPELDAAVGTVLEWVAMPALDGDGQHEAFVHAERALARVGASGCAGCEWEDLGDRERALVAVARGIVREPSLLIVDDLTVALGLEEADEVMRLVYSLAKEQGLGVLASVSDAKATRWSDRIGTLSGGELLIPSSVPRQGRSKVIGLPSDGRDRDGV
jgi:predicted ABC-type transport system involved in lysophospholipase L1 biosynthesis ATPase subunit